MGILKLSELIRDKASKSIKQKRLEAYKGRTVAIDASMVLYQTLIAIRYGKDELTNSSGEQTAHIQGLLYKTINLLEKGITPVFVFDGKAPEMKRRVLDKRRERKEMAVVLLEAAETEAAELKLAKQTVRVTPYHNESAQKLLRLMGVPFVVAPTEAEAYCAALSRAGYVDAVGSDDMDSLTFGGTLLLRHFLAPAAKKVPVSEITLSLVLSGLGLTAESFIDLCILLGCDYCDSPRGVGPKRALDLIREYVSIEEIIKVGKISPPDAWDYKAARELFLSLADPSEVPKCEFKCSPASSEELAEFLVQNNNFDPHKVQGAISRLGNIAKSVQQKTLSSFFKKK